MDACGPYIQLAEVSYLAINKWTDSTTQKTIVPFSKTPPKTPPHTHKSLNFDRMHSQGVPKSFFKAFNLPPSLTSKRSHKNKNIQKNKKLIAR
jgi:hypothetical protein